MSIASRVIKLVHKHFTNKSFSYLLGTSSARLSDKFVNNKVIFDYIIPNRFCRPVKPTSDSVSTTISNSSTKYVMTIGPIIALFDELSTFGFMYYDKTLRGGVSVYLSANMFTTTVK